MRPLGWAQMAKSDSCSYKKRKSGHTETHRWKIQQESDHLQAKQRGHRRNRTLRHLALGCPASRTVGKCLLFKPPSLVLYYGSPSKLIHTAITPLSMWLLSEQLLNEFWNKEDLWRMDGISKERYMVDVVLKLDCKWYMETWKRERIPRVENSTWQIPR